MPERVVGYLLLAVGIVVMIFSVYYAYNVLTNRIKPLTVYHASETKPQQPVTQKELLDNPSTAMQLQSQMLSHVMEKQMIPSLNLGATLFLMYFVMLLGYRLSSLGVQLMRPIQVKLREQAEKPKEGSSS
jgi:hypothetical protein